MEASQELHHQCNFLASESEGVPFESFRSRRDNTVRMHACCCLSAIYTIFFFRCPVATAFAKPLQS